MIFFLEINVQIDETFELSAYMCSTSPHWAEFVDQVCRRQQMKAEVWKWQTHTHTESMCHVVCKYGFQKQSLSKEKVLGILNRPTSEECLVCDSIDDRRKPLTTEGVCGVHTRREGEWWKFLAYSATSDCTVRHILRICQVNNINCAIIGLFYYHFVA